MDLLNKLNVLKSSSNDDDDDKEDVNNEDIVSIHAFFIKFYNKKIETIYKQSILGLLRNETLFRITILLVVYFILFLILSIAQFFLKAKKSTNDTILVWSRFGLSAIVFFIYEAFTLVAYRKPELVFGNGANGKRLKRLLMFVSFSFDTIVTLFIFACSILFSNKSAAFYTMGFVISCSYLRVYNSLLNWRHHTILTTILLAGLLIYNIIMITEETKKIIVWEVIFLAAMYLIYLYAVRKAEIWRRFFNVLLVFFNNKNALAHHNEKIYYSLLKNMFPFVSLPRALKKSTYSKVFQYEERTRGSDKSTNEDTEEEEGEEINNNNNNGNTNTIMSITESSIQSDANEQQSISMSLLSQKEENSNERNETELITLTEKDTNENRIFGAINFDLVVVEGGTKRRSSWHKEYMKSLQRAFSLFSSANKSLCKVIKVNGTTVYFVVDPTSIDVTKNHPTNANYSTEQDTEETRLKKQKKGYVTDKQRKQALNRMIDFFAYLLENKGTMKENENATLFKTFRAALVQGSLSGGIVDPRKPSLDIWGDTFNAAVKLICNCPQDSVMISGRLVRFVNKKYSLTSLKIDEEDITITNSRVIELTEQSDICKEVWSESVTTISHDDYEGRSEFLDETNDENDSDENDVVSSVSNTESSISNTSKEWNAKETNSVGTNDVVVDMDQFSQPDNVSKKSHQTKEHSEKEKRSEEKNTSEEEEEEEEPEIDFSGAIDEKRAFKIIQQDYDTGYFNYTKSLGKGALWAAKKHNIDEVKEIYQIDKITLQYKNKNVENNWDVYYATEIYQRSVSSVLMLFCFLTSFAASIYDNTYMSKDDNIVYTSFIAPFCWFVPLILSLPAICNCYHNLVKSSVILAAVAVDVIVFVYVKLGMYSQLPVKRNNIL